MSAAETLKAIEGLSAEQRRKALQLKAQLEVLESELQAILSPSEAKPGLVDLSTRGIDESQAADLRARLSTFSEDWDRPEASIYDQSPAR